MGFDTAKKRLTQFESPAKCCHSAGCRAFERAGGCFIQFTLWPVVACPLFTPESCVYVVAPPQGGDSRIRTPEGGTCRQ